MNFIDAGYHWIEMTTPADRANHERRFQQGPPAPVTQVEAGRVHALAARFEVMAQEDPIAIRAAAWRDVATDLRGLLHVDAQ